MKSAPEYPARFSSVTFPLWEASSCLGQPVSTLPTPALVVDLDAMDRNLQAMAAFARTHGVQLRPHAKMHKSAALALRQMEAGAVGVCVQKTSEAEVLAAAGVRNIYISNQVVAPDRLQRVAALALALQAQGGRLALAVDHLQGVQGLARALGEQAPAGVMDVFIELDVGQGRCGVDQPQAVVALAQAISAHPALRLGGLHAYNGRAQHLRTVGERQAAVAKAVQQVQLARELVRAVGLDLPVITGAGTGTFGWEARSQVYTELQAGSYLFMDADYARNERDAHQPVFEHALFVKSQVMSVQAQHVVVDAGHKSHAIDSGLPTVWQHALRATACNDEHTTLVIDEAIAQDKSTPALAALPGLGDTVWLVPGHCDPTVNLHDVMVGVRGGLDHGTVTELIRVDARGCLQ